MAKLSARGRHKIFEVERQEEVKEGSASSLAGITWRKHAIALMSDGSVLERTGWNARDQYSPKGVRYESGTWKVRGKIKAGATAESLLEGYIKKGYRPADLSGLDQFNRDYATALAASVRMGGPVPEKPATPAPGRVLRTEKAAERSRKAATKAKEKRAHVQATQHGAGFYVRNRTTSAFKDWAAELGPYKSLNEALPHAWERYQHFLQMKFTYLLPVEIVEAPSRQDAEWGHHKDIHVWWTNGKNRGAPVDPRQMKLFGNGG